MPNTINSSIWIHKLKLMNSKIWVLNSKQPNHIPFSLQNSELWIELHLIFSNEFKCWIWSWVIPWNITHEFRNGYINLYILINMLTNWIQKPPTWILIYEFRYPWIHVWAKQYNFIWSFRAWIHMNMNSCIHIIYEFINRNSHVYEFMCVKQLI